MNNTYMYRVESGRVNEQVTVVVRKKGNEGIKLTSLIVNAHACTGSIEDVTVADG